jgi:hypothetical protein
MWLTLAALLIWGAADSFIHKIERRHTTNYVLHCSNGLCAAVRSRKKLSLALEEGNNLGIVEPSIGVDNDVLLFAGPAVFKGDPEDERERRRRLAAIAFTHMESPMIQNGMGSSGLNGSSWSKITAGLCGGRRGVCARSQVCTARSSALGTSALHGPRSWPT